MADYSDIVKNIDDITDYISNQELRSIINIGIHDAIRHSNNIGKNSSVLFDLTINTKNDNSRILKCETFFDSEITSEESKNINYPIVRRTTVEKDKQSDIVNIDIILEA